MTWRIIFIECTVNATLNFVDIASKEPFSLSHDEDVDQKNFGVQFRVSSNSDDCHLDFATTVMSSEDTVNFIVYILLMNFLVNPRTINEIYGHNVNFCDYSVFCLFYSRETY